MKKIKKAAVAAAMLLFFCAVASLSACGHTHELEKVSAQQAFCLKDGNIEYWECETCGKLFADENAETELAPEDVILPAGHKPELIPAETSDDVFTCTAREYYRCTACETLFADEACTEELTVDDIYTPKTFTLNEPSVAKDNSTGRLYAVIDGKNTELAVTETNWVLRVFLGWNTESSVAEMAKTNSFRINLNMDTQGSQSSGQWPKFMFGCDSRGAWTMFQGETNGKILSSLSGGSALVTAFTEQNGLWFTIVRASSWVMAYAEDSAGNRISLGSYQMLDDTPLVKMTLGVNSGYYATEDCPAVATGGVLVIGTNDPSAPSEAKKD